MYFVYLLRCSDDTLYTGCTNDLDRRRAAHTALNGAKVPRSRRRFALFYWEPCADKSAALRRERAIKRLTRKQKLELIQNAPASAPELPIFLQ